MGEQTEINIYSATFKGRTIVLTGNFELLVDGEKQDKKTSTSILLKSEATFNGDFKQSDGGVAKVRLEYSTFFALYSMVILYIDNVFIDETKGSIMSKSMNNRLLEGNPKR